MYCNCSKNGHYHPNNNYRVVEVDEEGICLDCGYYAMASKVRGGDIHVEGDVVTDDDFRLHMVKSDSTMKDYVKQHTEYLEREREKLGL